MKKIYLMLALLSLFSGSIVFSQAYKINIKINELSDTSIYLAYHFGGKKFVQDTLHLDTQGFGSFEGDEKLPGGIYLIVLPDMTFFEILLTDNQKFSIETSANNPLKNVRFQNSPENVIFINYQRFMTDMQSRSQWIQQRLRVNSENKDSLLILQGYLKNLDKQVKEYWNTILTENRDSFISNIIRGMMNVIIPEFEIPPHVVNKDSLRWVLGYNYNRDHFFDNINFADERLLRTPIIHNRLEHFFTRMLVQRPDSIIPQAVRVIELSRVNPKVYQYVLVYLLNHYETSQIMGLDEVFVYLAERYYLSGQAHWASQDLLDKLSSRVERIKPNLIGRVAKDLRMQTQKGEFINLHQIKADFIILYFYEPGCGHCKIVTPQLWEIYEQFRDKSVEVFAVYILNDRNEWIEFTSSNNYDWINVYDPTNASFFRHFYDIYSTPVIYLLDRDKKIIAKRISAETVENILKENIR